jgi:hypothetical protein
MNPAVCQLMRLLVVFDSSAITSLYIYTPGLGTVIGREGRGRFEMDFARGVVFGASFVTSGALLKKTAI